MKRAGGLCALVATLLLAGCIPTGAPSERDGYGPPHRIEPDVSSLTPEPPVWEAHPADAATIDVAGGTYTAQPGDTLHGIGEKTGVGWEVLARANGLTPPVSLTPGQQLTIPAGHYHIVKGGESGIAIARAHGVHWTEIVALNGLADPYVIHTGQRLLLPSGMSHAEAFPGPQDAMEARAAAFNLDDVVQGGGEPAMDAGVKPTRLTPSPKRPLPPTVAVAEPRHFTDGTFAWPLRGNLVARFGGGSHGIDIAAPAGTIVDASASGVVAFVGQVAGYGGTAILRHGEGWLTIYSHIAHISVTRGETIRRGEAVGITGGPALHFEIRQHKVPVDPLRKLS